MKKTFCCKRLANFTQWGDPDCGRHDLVFVGGTRRYRTDHVELFLGIVSNATLLFPLVMLKRRGRVSEVILGTGLMVCSLLYHACETLDARILNMNAGNFHRLDNVLSILCFGSLGPMLMRATTPDVSSQHIDAFRSSLLVVTLVFQELNPWHVACTIAPLVFAAIFLAAWTTTRRAQRRLRRRSLALPISLQLVSFACFVKGLDQDRDPRRCWHFAWHALNALSSSLFTSVLDPLPPRIKKFH